MNGYDRGNETEAYVIGFCLNRGNQIAIPVGVRRFDLLIEIDGIFQKCQIKTGRMVGGSLVFNTCTIHPVTGKRRPYTKDQADFFIVRNPESGVLYKVPFSEVGPNEFRLRIDPPKKQARMVGIHWAKDYIF